MAQIMNYYQWPVTGRGSHSYEWRGQTLSMDFSTVTFDWANMQDTYSGTRDSEEAQNAVATLMLACGISVYMGYGVNESGASLKNIYRALFDYFDYDADYLYRSDIETSDWENLIYNELVNKRPVYYEGVPLEGVGHAFVCDGYSTDGLFHINWGWGDGGGYYLLNVLGGYDYNQKIIYGISPIKNMEEYMEDAIQNGISINAENFPDDNFRNCLLEHDYGRDGVLIEAEIKRMGVELMVSSKNISNLQGIEHFTALTALWCNHNQLTTLDVSKNTALTYLFCDNNQLTCLDISGCTALTVLSCSNNPLTFLNCSRGNFKGETMDNLISSLPRNTTNEIYKFYVYDDSSADEGNICTKAQVATVKSKGWTPYYYDATDKVWKEYEGEDLEDITSISGVNANSEVVIVYTISGKRQVMKKDDLKLLPKGLYIINGRKHVVK